jgi:hypothetical protein
MACFSASTIARCPLPTTPHIACAHNKRTAGHLESDPDGGPIIPLGGAVIGLIA